MSLEEIERLLNNTPRTDLIQQVRGEYSQTSTPGKIHVNRPVEVFTPENNLHKSAPRNVGNTTNR
jgi:hypothetical protein